MYIGVKDFIAEFKEPFDKNAISLKQAKQRLQERGEKATAEAVKEEAKVVLAEWKQAQDRGTKLHKQIQDRKAKSKSCIIEGWESNKGLSKPLDESVNKLKNNTSYIEKRIISNKYGIIGYGDDVDVVKNFINIEDTKTTKAIYKTSAIKLKTGFTLPPTYFYPPIAHLQDCNFNEIALQMSMYMYILWVHNKNLKPGKMFIRHIKTNPQDRITEEILIPVPYLREEVKALLKDRLKNAI